MKIKHYTHEQIDAAVERTLAAVSLILAAIGLGAGDWPRSAVIASVVVAILLVVVAVWSELARRPDQDEGSAA